MPIVIYYLLTYLFIPVCSVKVTAWTCRCNALLIIKKQASKVHVLYSWFPPGLEKWEDIFQSGKSQGILLRLGNLPRILPKILEKSGNIILQN